MQIKEVEEKTGLTRSNIRFYEKQHLLLPSRNSNSGYREYSEEDIDNIKKIAYLRTIGISVIEIKKIISGEHSLLEIVRNQEQVLSTQINEMQNAQNMCKKMLLSKNLNYENLHVEDYITEIKKYWKENTKIFKVDSANFIDRLGGFTVWKILTLLCFIFSILSFPYLPNKIPVQWNETGVSSEMNKIFIFIYPILCVVIRLILPPFIKQWLQGKVIYSRLILNYITNFSCFVLLSIEVFTILYLFGVVHSVMTLLLLDIIIFFGILLIGWEKIVYR